MIFRPLEGMPLVWRIALALMIVALAVILLLILTWAINGEAAAQTPPPQRLTDADVILIRLHGPNGQIIYVNPQSVVTVRPPRVPDHVTPEIHCLLHTADGKFVAVSETCEQFVTEAKEKVPFPSSEEKKP